MHARVITRREFIERSAAVAGGILLSPPCAAGWLDADETGWLMVFALGADNAVWYRVWDSADWSDWLSLGGILIAPPSAVAWQAGGQRRVSVFARDRNNNVAHRRWTDGAWGGWGTLGWDDSYDVVYLAEPPVFTSAISAVAVPDGVQLFVLGDDNAVWHRPIK